MVVDKGVCEWLNVFFLLNSQYHETLVQSWSGVKFTGEIFELKNELNRENKEKKREAVKKVIASMTVGKDVRWVEYSAFWLHWKK